MRLTLAVRSNVGQYNLRQDQFKLSVPAVRAHCVDA
jgi:hypothetical protein